MATGLLDIADAFEELEISEGVKVTVKGIKARGISYLFARFPELRLIFGGRADQIAAQQIILVAPDAVAAMIAVSCGYVPRGDDGDAQRQAEAEAKADELVLGIQVMFLDAIIRLTMPKGVGPFVETLERLGAFVEQGFGPEAATTSGQQSPNVLKTVSAA